MCSRASGVKRQAALHDHEAHLRHRGPGERGLHRRLREHHQAAEQRREAADDDQHRQHARRGQHHIGEADQQEAAGVDDAGVQQGRDRGRRLHHLGEPAVGRELGRLEDGGQRDQRGGGDRPASRPRCPRARRGSWRCRWCRSRRRGPAPRATSAMSPTRRERRALAGRALRGRRARGRTAAACCRQKLVAIQAEHQLDEVAGLHQQQHDGQRRAQPAHELALPRFAVEVGRGVAHHDPADEAKPAAA